MFGKKRRSKNNNNNNRRNNNKKTTQHKQVVVLEITKEADNEQTVDNYSVTEPEVTSKDTTDLNNSAIIKVQEICDDDEDEGDPNNLPVPSKKARKLDKLEAIEKYFLDEAQHPRHLEIISEESDCSSSDKDKDKKAVNSNLETIVTTTKIDGQNGEIEVETKCTNHSFVKKEFQPDTTEIDDEETESETSKIDDKKGETEMETNELKPETSEINDKKGESYSFAKKEPTETLSDVLGLLTNASIIMTEDCRSSSSRSSSSSRGSSLCTAKYIPSTASITDVNALINNKNSTTPLDLRQICLNLLMKLPFGLDALEELSYVSKSIDDRTNLNDWLTLARTENSNKDDTEKEMNALLEKEREIQRELDQLEDEKRRLLCDIAAKNNNFASKSTEDFRQLMLDEYMSKVAALDSRKHKKIIKFSSCTDLTDRRCYSSTNDLETEFLRTVEKKLRTTREKSAEEIAESAINDPGVLILNGDNAIDTKNLPKHFQEFIKNINEGCVNHRKSDIWSPGKSVTTHYDSLPLNHHQQQQQQQQQRQEPRVKDGAPIIPVWTPQSSPTLERKEFRPVNFQSPVLQRKKVEFSVEKSSKEAPPVPVPKSVVVPPVRPTSIIPPPPVPKSVAVPPVPPTSIIPPPPVLSSVFPNQPEKPIDITIIDEHDDPTMKIQNVETPEIKTFQNRKIEGIGPTTKEGMPLVLRSEVKDTNQSKWYKKMYDTIHKQKKHNDEYVTIRYKQKRSKYPYTSGYLSEPESTSFGGYESAPDSHKYETTPARPKPQHTPLTRLMKESGYESDSTLVFLKKEDNSNVQQLSPQEQKTAYKVIQQGGDVPLYGLRKPAPERPKEESVFFNSISERRSFIERSIKSHSEIVCYPITIVPKNPPMTVRKTVCVPKPPALPPPFPPKRYSSRNNSTLRLISTIKTPTPLCKRHESCFANVTTPRTAPKISPKQKLNKTKVVVAPPPVRKNGPSLTKKSATPQKVKTAPPKKIKQPPVTTVTKAVRKPVVPPPQVKPKVVKRSSSAEPSVSAIRVYLQHTKPVSDSKFVYVDKFRSRSLSPVTSEIKQPPRTKLFFSQTTRPIILDQKQKKVAPNFITCECLTRYLKEDGKDPKFSLLNRYYKFRDLNDLYDTIERLLKLEKIITNHYDCLRKRNEAEIIDYERWKKVRVREKAERELGSLYDELHRQELENNFLICPKALKQAKWKREQDRGLRSKEKTVTSIKQDFESLKFAPKRYRNNVEELCYLNETYKPLWRANSVADVAQKFRSKSEGRRTDLLTQGCGSKIWSSLSLEQVDVLKKQLTDIYATKQQTTPVPAEFKSNAAQSPPLIIDQSDNSASTDDSTNTVVNRNNNNIKSIKNKVNYFETTFSKGQYVPTIHQAGGGIETTNNLKNKANSCENLSEVYGENQLAIKLATEPLYPATRTLLPKFPKLRMSFLGETQEGDCTFKSEVKKLKDKFERAAISSFNKAVPKRSKSDSHLLVRNNVDYLRSRYEFPALCGRGRSRIRRGGVVSPIFLRAEDRFMPHINIISKIANLYARNKLDLKCRSAESLAEFWGCPVGEVEKLTGKFDSLISANRGSDFSPYLAATTWTAHRYPKFEDNLRSLSSPDDTFLGERTWRRSKSAPLKRTSLVRFQESPIKYTENDVTIHYKVPVRQEVKEYFSEDELATKQAEIMREIYKEERRRKYLQELQDARNRRHTDNFTPSQKSPIISLNRYDDFEFVKEKPRSPEPRLVAKALYNFVGHTARELTFHKGDLIYVKRQVDKNWYEGELNAMIGLFPVNYVEIIQPVPETQTMRRNNHHHEGQGRAKFNFIAQTHLELSLAKGELVTITKRVDDNWYEGKIGGRKGIFPVSYVDVLIDPSNNTTVSAQVSSKPVASPASHSLLLNGSAGGKESMGSHSYTPNYDASKVRYDPVRQPMTQALHIETQSEPIPYRAVFKYMPQNDDELELWEGDTVYVLERCDDGWYVGSSDRTGAFGTFPGNYVEKI